MMMKTARLRTRLFMVALVMVAVVATAGVIFGTRADATSNGGPAMLIEPANVQALNAPARAIAGIPPEAHGMGTGLDPAPGTAHRLGNGVVAWPAGSRVCYYESSGGGCIQPQTRAIDVVITDADGFRSGNPARISGVAVDAVTKVTADLKDGSTLSVQPVNNWYEIDLPESAAPWDVTHVSALDTNGDVIVSYDTPTTPLD
jgi:hypothetical protein